MKRGRGREADRHSIVYLLSEAHLGNLLVLDVPAQAEQVEELAKVHNNAGAVRVRPPASARALRGDESPSDVQLGEVGVHGGGEVARDRRCRIDDHVLGHLWTVTHGGGGGGEGMGEGGVP